MTKRATILLKLHILNPKTEAGGGRNKVYGRGCSEIVKEALGEI